MLSPPVASSRQARSPARGGPALRYAISQAKHHAAIRGARDKHCLLRVVGWGREPEAQGRVKVREKLGEATAPSNAWSSEEGRAERRKGRGSGERKIQSHGLE